VLQGMRCMISVKIEQDESGAYPPKNVVTRVKPIAKPEANGSARPDFNDKLDI
jgi:hypothetical protein